MPGAGCCASTPRCRELDAELEAAHGLPLTSYDVLINLQAAPGRRLRMAELADSVLLSRSGVTRLVDRLERDGLIVRDACVTTAAAASRCSPTRARSCSPARAPTHLAGVRERFLRHFAEASCGRSPDLGTGFPGRAQSQRLDKT